MNIFTEAVDLSARRDYLLLVLSLRECETADTNAYVNAPAR